MDLQVQGFFNGRGWKRQSMSSVVPRDVGCPERPRGAKGRSGHPVFHISLDNHKAVIPCAPWTITIEIKLTMCKINPPTQTAQRRPKLRQQSVWRATAIHERYVFVPMWANIPLPKQAHVSSKDCNVMCNLRVQRPTCHRPKHNVCCCSRPRSQQGAKGEATNQLEVVVRKPNHACRPHKLGKAHRTHQHAPPLDPSCGYADTSQALDQLISIITAILILLCAP
mmetsp:Transcript_59466/g.193955  ORF Transcript_59466/g.193955 Transcript_59466/m.193955 type:complete len:224 (-) Transcript_59466:2895-3566(-)